MNLQLKTGILEQLHENLGNRSGQLLTDPGNTDIRRVIATTKCETMEDVHALGEMQAKLSLIVASRRVVSEQTRKQLERAGYCFEGTGDPASLAAASELWERRGGNDKGAAIYTNRLANKPTAEIARAIENYCASSDFMGAYQMLKAYLEHGMPVDTSPLYAPCETLIAGLVKKGFRKMPLQQASILLELHEMLSHDVPKMAAQYAAIAEQAGASAAVLSLLRTSGGVAAEVPAPDPAPAVEVEGEPVREQPALTAAEELAKAQESESPRPPSL